MTTSQYLTIIKTKPWIRIGFYTAFLLSNERISIAWLKSDILERNFKQKLENVLKTNAIADSGRELHDWNFSFSVFLMLFDVSTSLCGCVAATATAEMEVWPPTLGRTFYVLIYLLAGSPGCLSSVKLIGVNIYIDYQTGHYRW